MVNSTASVPSISTPFRVLPLLGRAYLGLVLAALVGLAVLSVTAPWLAPRQAWVHQGIVSVFAVVLLLRLRRAVGGSVPALRATGIISGVLVMVNVVEARTSGFLPAWMQALMLVTAVVLLGIVAMVIRIRVGR